MDNSFDYLDKLYRDLLEQFRGQPNILVFQKALARQLNNLYEFFDQLNTLRHLQTAEGVQLDGIGDIVVMSRQDALVISKLANQIVPMDDETYRLYLAWKIYLNTTNCTYQDVWRALTMFWDKTPLLYEEIIDQPATIIFKTPVQDPSAPPIDLSILALVPTIKAAGVGMIVLSPTDVMRFINIFNFVFTDLAFHLTWWNGTYVYSVLLDGKYLLDGSRLLNSGRSLWHVFNLADFAVHILFQNHSSRDTGILLNGEYLLDGSWLLNNTLFTGPRLDGENILNGSWLLDAGRRIFRGATVIDLKIAGITFQNNFGISAGMLLNITFRNHGDIITGTALNGAKDLDGLWYLDSSRETIFRGLSGSVSITGNWWLDGSVALNGSNSLNEYNIQEDL